VPSWCSWRLEEESLGGARKGAVNLTMSVLFVLALVILMFTAIYRLAIGSLRIASLVPGVGRLMSVQSSEGVDTFKLFFCGLFSWSVVVNTRKGTIAGSIQVDAKKQWGPLAILAAIAAAFLVPVVSGTLMPAALIALAVGRAKALLRRERDARREGSLPRQHTRA
jgi:hypothetical protein